MVMASLISLVISTLMLHVADTMLPNIILQVILIFIFPQAFFLIAGITILYVILFITGGQR